MNADFQDKKPQAAEDNLLMALWKLVIPAQAGIQKLPS
jgi:hypothetical protein